MMLHQSILTQNSGLRPTFVEINLAVLTANYQAIQRAVGERKVMVVVKANAYGHGLVRVAQHLQGLGVAYLAVAYLEEAVLLRASGISVPVLVLGGIALAQIDHFIEYDVTITASSIENLQAIEARAAALGRRAKVHLKIDTGMGRVGVQYAEAEPFLALALRCKNCQIEAIYTHFANSDSAELTHANQQLDRFNQLCQFFPQRGLPMPLRHAANSGAILQMPSAYFDMVRAGIMFYGVYPDTATRQTIAIKPALTWKTQVVYSKLLPPHYPVSYGSTWVSEQPAQVVTLPVGYGDGYFRALSNKAQVVLGGKRYPIVGRVCMDQMMVRVDRDVRVGERVVLLGEGGISAETLAQWAGTIPYEILTNINTRVPRIYVDR